ncbi:glycosyl hydrolase family 28-related protein [Paenibacillus hodogayensis]|uniref:Glycosyl hydrolase family 28-related protein n=1 Tax=Paenibacillus hodogayensis TaxID=279208 RepID=A0ABV5VQM0_9BACL
MLEEQKVERTENGSESNNKEIISRRKLLASLGMAGVALAYTGVMNAAIPKAYADEVDHRTKVKDLMKMNLVISTTIDELRANTQPDAELVYFVRTHEKEGPFYYDATDTTSSDNGGTILVSSMGARFKRSFSGSVNVKWFGAKGDGANDDTAAIQQAINAKEGTVFFPKGKYNITAPLVIETGDSLIGEGPEVTMIEKTTTTLASLGTRLIPGNASSDNYNVDAAIIVLAPDGDFARYIHLEGLFIKRSDSLPRNSSYCFFAPRVYFMTQKNMEYRNADIGYYTINAWMITLERVSSRTVNRAFICGDADAPGGGGTSHTVTSCWAGGCQKSAWKINVSYSSFTACGADYIGPWPQSNAGNSAEYIFRLRGVGLNLIGCATEESRGPLMYVTNGSLINVLGFYTWNYYGDNAQSGTYAITLKNESQLTLSGGYIKLAGSGPITAKIAEVTESSKLFISGLKTTPDYMSDAQTIFSNLGEVFIAGARMKSVTAGQQTRDSYWTNGCINIFGSWDKALLKFTDATSWVTSYLWVDTSGILRTKRSSAPTSDHDGYAVGEQGIRKGTSTQSANASAVQFLVPHGLGSVPSYYNLLPASADASGIQYVEADSTNLIIHYSLAPSAGSSNMIWKWEARI